jgi:protein FRA10AC1
MASFNAAHLAALDSAARQRQRSELMGLNAYDRHKRLVQDLITYYGGTLPSSDKILEMNNQQQQHGAPANGVPTCSLRKEIIKTDEDVLRESYRFIRTPEDDADVDSWTVRLAKKYYSRLFREYCIADLSRYKEGKLGLRWRTQREVVSGKGQFTCGTRGCEERRGLASFEVPFGYIEAGEKKQALVKVRLCPEHAYQLNYKKNKQAEERQEAAATTGKMKKKKGKKKKKKKGKKGVKEQKSKRHRKAKSSSSESDGGTSEHDGSSSSSSSSSDEEKEELPHRRKKGRASDGYEQFFTGIFE